MIQRNLHLEEFAAGIGNDVLHKRFSEIAQNALDDGRVIGIDRPLAPIAQPVIDNNLAQTAEIEKMPANKGGSNTSMNALARSAGLPDAAAVGQN